MKRETELQCGSNCDCASKQNWEKNILLNWLYIHEKKNHNISLSLCRPLSLYCSLSLSLSVSWCQLSTRYQCLLLHIAIKATSAGSNPAFQTQLSKRFFAYSVTFHLSAYPENIPVKPLQFSDFTVQVGWLAALKGYSTLNQTWHVLLLILESLFHLTLGDITSGAFGG